MYPWKRRYTFWKSLRLQASGFMLDIFLFDSVFLAFFACFLPSFLPFCLPSWEGTHLRTQIWHTPKASSAHTNLTHLYTQRVFGDSSVHTNLTHLWGWSHTLDLHTFPTVRTHTHTLQFWNYIRKPVSNPPFSSMSGWFAYLSRPIRSHHTQRPDRIDGFLPTT